MNQRKKGRAVRSMGRGQSKKRRGNYRRRRGRSGGNSGLPQFQGKEKLYYQYIQLIEEHNTARKKYFEMYYRAGGRQIQKLENDFYQTMNKLREFEMGLSEDDKAYIQSKIGPHQLDTDYSSRRNLPANEGELEVTEGDFEDPHLLQSQITADYSHDTEESVGTLEDYKKLKGITE